MGIMGLSCIFPVPNIKKTAEFYVSKLEFRAVEYLECKEPHICIYKDNIEVILLQANTDKVLPNRELYGYGYDAYFYAENQEQLEKEFMEKGIKIVKSLNKTDYQNKEFVVEDLDGRWLAFGLKATFRNQKNLAYGFLQIVIGIALQVLSHTFGGSDVKDFFSGFLLGVSIAEILAGVYILGKNIVKR